MSWENFFSLTPILGTIKISEELARNYNLYENTMIEKSNPNLVPELRNKLDYLSEKSINK
ncbi:MAG: hypothetical protein QXU74_02760 [Candidatus Aenigmatarchaeota archaeon]